MITTSRLRSIAAFAAAALWLARTAWDNPNIYDEGIVVVGALRLLDGDLPYRDFWTIYPPGVFLLYGAVLELFGPTLVVERAASLLLAATLVAACFTIVDRRAGLLRAAWAGGLITVWVAAGRLYGSPIVPAMLLALGSALLMTSAMRAARPGRALVAGVVTGLATVFRHDLGGYTFLAVSLGVVGTAFFRGGQGSGTAIRAGRAYVAGAFGVVFIGVAALAATTGLSPAVEQLIGFPLFEFPAVRHLPYPSVLLAGLPITLAAAALVAAIARKRRAEAVDGGEGLTLPLLALFFVGQSIVRSDFVHVLPSFVIALTAAGIAFGPVVRTGSPVYSALHLGAAAAIAILAVLALPSAEPRALHRYRIATAAGLSSSADPAPYQEAIEIVERVTPAGAPIFVGNDRHDRIFINDVLFYALAGRRPATKYHELHPGVATAARVQREIVDDIEAQRVQVVVIRSERHPPETVNASSRSTGVTILDDYLRKTFVPFARLGDYEIRRRRASGMARIGGTTRPQVEGH